MDLDLVVAGIATHVRVFDGGAVAGYVSLEGELMEHYVRRGNLVSEIGGFVVEARQSTAWEVIVELLVTLHAERPALFHRLMRACVNLSSGEREKDAGHDLLPELEQQIADVASQRETRRDSDGYVSPAQARAFLQAARDLDLTGPAPPVDPVARACLRDLARDAVDDASPHGDVAAVIEVLSEAGVIALPRALLTAGDQQADRLAAVHALIASHLSASEELAFLTNVMLSGCGVNGRALTPQEAGDAVLATLNLGIENQPRHWRSAGLVTPFRIGWSVLHRDLCLYATRTLVDVLADISCSDRDVQWALEALRRELTRHLRDGAPWRARQALDAILMLDPPSWAVLRALIAEYPTLHTSLTNTGPRALKLDPEAVTFAAGNADVATVRRYLASLAVSLTG
jgi:hypothetical protein